MFYFLRRRMFLPLFGSSLLAMGLYLTEWRLRGWLGPRLHLNLFLAWVPYMLAMLAVAIHRRRPEARWRLVAPLVLWLLFLPNAPYLITDLYYLRSPQLELWQCVAVFSSFAVCGLMLGIVSVFYVHTLVHSVWGPAAGWGVVLTALGLSGPGVYLGRFLRLNSWDVFSRPDAVLFEVRDRLMTEFHGMRPIAFMAVFSALMFAQYYLVLSIRVSPPTREEIEAGRIEGLFP